MNQGILLLLGLAMGLVAALEPASTPAEKEPMTWIDWLIYLSPSILGILLLVLIFAGTIWLYQRGFGRDVSW